MSNIKEFLQGTTNGLNKVIKKTSLSQNPCPVFDFLLKTLSNQHETQNATEMQGP